MKLLRITADGLPLFKEKLDICFYAQQRVSEDQKDILYPLFSNIYLNPANGFIGINASGKTSVLKVILLSLGILNNEPINHIETRDILGNAQKAVLNIFFYSESKKEICRLETMITSRQTKAEGVIYRILSEKLWSKQADEVITRKSLLDFDGKDPVMIRSGQEDFLSDDVSIMIARNKKTGENMRVVNLLQFTNINVLPFSDNIPAEVITYLDPTVESLQFDEKDQKTVIRLKFKGKEEIVMNNPIQLNNYLSSGTVKGMITFTLAQEVRTVNSEVPIIFLTAKSLKEDILEGFKLGADDYITKPFSMEELVFRIEAILRRVKGKKGKEITMYKIGKFTFDTQKQVLMFEDKITKLTTKESELLSLLCAHVNEILERNFALKTIWIDDNYFNARSMDVYITKLRKHLKDDPSIEIINIHGKGYKLIAPDVEVKAK